MAESEKQVAGASETVEELSLLDRAIQVTSQTPEDTTKELFSVLMGQSLQGTLSWDKNVGQTIENAIALIDQKMSLQLSAVMRDPKFQKLEGSWRGLGKLVRESETGPDLKIKMIDFSQNELLEQFEDAAAVDRSPIFEALYQKEFGTAGGEPYGVLIGDYEFSHSDEDVALLSYMAEVASASHAPFVAATNAQMFEYDDIMRFDEHRPVAAAFDSPQYAAWNAFRESDEAKYVALTLPRTLARQPYGSKGKSSNSFAFEELSLDAEGAPRPKSNADLVWSNAAYEMGLKMSQAYTEFGWCTAIRGLDNGGKVTDLPNVVFKSDAGDNIQACPTEVNLTDEREKELTDLGFLPLVHYKNTNYAVFLGGQTAQKPKTFTDPEATANAAIAARLPYTMAASRIAHYLKVMGRDQIGSAIEKDDIERQMTSWIQQYTNGGAIGNAERARTPLAESKIEVVEQPGRPGSFSAVAYLRPWLQMEELTTSVRMVAKIPG